MKGIKNWKFGTKLTVIICIFMLVPTILGTYLSLNGGSKELLKATENSLDEISAQILKICQTQHALLVEKLNADLNVAHKICDSYGNLNIDPDNPINLAAINQITKAKENINVPAWKFGNQSVNNNFKIVDEIQQLVGGTCTIFQKIPGDNFLRISTNVKKLDGNRAVGTYIPSSSKVAQSLLNKKLYTGKAFVVNKDYITAYDPIISSSGEVVGALYVGIPLMNNMLKENINSIAIGKKGYAFCFDSKGKFTIHPEFEGQIKTDNPAITAVLENKSHKDSIKFYNKNIKENVILANKYFGEWDWNICANGFRERTARQHQAPKVCHIYIPISYHRRRYIS